MRPSNSMNYLESNDDFVDSLRGMLLLGIYGDVFGAAQENATIVTKPPKSSLIGERSLPNDAEPWGTWITKTIASSARGIPTDDSCFRLFLLHPWLQNVAEGVGRFDENEFRLFLTHQKQISLTPNYLQPVRNQQIDDWLAMYAAHQESTSAVFYKPELPIVFGMFMFAESAAVLGGSIIAETFHRYENFCRLDQSYARSATGFYATLVHMAINSPGSGNAFATWFLQTCEQIIDSSLNRNNSHHVNLIELFYSMKSLGENSTSKSGFEFAREFEQQVVRPTNPPFMSTSFSGMFDPYRFLAQMVAMIAYCRSDVLSAIRTIAFSTGDTDTTASMLGTLVGAYVGEKELRRDAELDESFRIIEQQLLSLFGLELSDSVSTFVRLKNEYVA